ncbi:MAG TPA: NAD(P)-dependent oxidoreductase [Candidatus Aquilonibacter sp.]|nr:NAD(P)-dependent oxidoreductase [Candidatus Aquilonibacter sp.]
MPTLDQAVFFPVSLNLMGRKCVVIGPSDDREAVEKEAALRESGADVTWIRDAATLRDDDVIDAFFVISTPQDDALSARLRALADRHRFLLCCIDQPAYGFVAMTAIAKAGPVRIAISTTGLAPRVGKRFKERLQAAMDATFVRFIECLAMQKTRMKRALPGPDHGAARRKAMIDAADGFDITIDVRYPQWFEDELEGMRPRVTRR